MGGAGIWQERLDLVVMAHDGSYSLFKNLPSPFSPQGSGMYLRRHISGSRAGKQSHRSVFSERNPLSVP